MTEQSTDRRAAVKAAYVSHIVAHSKVPTIRELAAATGISSTSLVVHYQEALADEGWLVRVGEGHRHRAYVPAGAREALQAWARKEQR